MLNFFEMIFVLAALPGSIALLCFGFLVISSFISSAWLLTFQHARHPLKELADHPKCPCRNEIQYDMGFLNEILFSVRGHPELKNLTPAAKTFGNTVLDIGSGSGRSSQLYIRTLFGPAINVVLSDRQPSTAFWKALAENDGHLSWVNRPVSDLADLQSLLCQAEAQIGGLSFVNSLHHLSDDDVVQLFRWAAAVKVSIFIADARRLHWTHPLLVPFVYFPAYLWLAWTGSGRQPPKRPIYRRIVATLMEGWIMSFDQLVGSAKRFSIDRLASMACAEGLSFSLHQDDFMNYIILVPNNLSST